MSATAKKHPMVHTITPGQAGIPGIIPTLVNTLETAEGEIGDINPPPLPEESSGERFSGPSD